MFEFLEDSHRATADRGAVYVGADQTRFDELFQLVQQSTYPIDMRAARVLALSAEQNPQLSLPHAAKMIQILQSTGLDGVKRGFLKMLEYVFADLSEDDKGLLIHYCFSILDNPKEAIAVRAYAINILVIAVKWFPDLAGEFIAMLEYMQEKHEVIGNSPALRASVRNALKSCLKQQKSKKLVR